MWRRSFQPIVPPRWSPWRPFGLSNARALPPSPGIKCPRKTPLNWLEPRAFLVVAAGAPRAQIVSLVPPLISFSTIQTRVYSVYVEKGWIETGAVPKERTKSLLIHRRRTPSWPLESAPSPVSVEDLAGRRFIIPSATARRGNVVHHPGVGSFFECRTVPRSGVRSP